MSVKSYPRLQENSERMSEGVIYLSTPMSHPDRNQVSNQSTT